MSVVVVLNKTRGSARSDMCISTGDTCWLVGCSMLGVELWAFSILITVIPPQSSVLRFATP